MVQHSAIDAPRKPETAADVSEGPTVSEDASQADISMLNDNWGQMNKSTEKLLGPKKRWSFLRHAVPMVLGVAFLMLTVTILNRITRIRVVSKELNTVLTASQAILGEAHGNFLDPNCTNLACRRKALDDSSLVQELSASNGKDWKEIQRDQGLQAQTLQDAAKELSEENSTFHNFSSVFTDALALLQKELESRGNQSALHWVEPKFPRDSSEVMAAGNVQDVIYTIYIGPKRFKVYCVMSVDGGGWTVSA